MVFMASNTKNKNPHNHMKGKKCECEGTIRKICACGYCVDCGGKA